MTQTLGEYRVGITFNPGGNEMVNKIKRAAADLIDLINTITDHTVCLARDNVTVEAVPIAEVLRLKVLAMTHIEDAAMWAVKAATKPARDA